MKMSQIAIRITDPADKGEKWQCKTTYTNNNNKEAEKIYSSLFNMKERDRK